MEKKLWADRKLFKSSGEQVNLGIAVDIILDGRLLCS